MAISPKRIAWDACSWIAHIQKEKILGPDSKAVVEDRGAMCRPVLNAADFLNEATRLLDTSRWTTVSASDTDPATPRHR